MVLGWDSCNLCMNYSCNRSKAIGSCTDSNTGCSMGSSTVSDMTGSSGSIGIGNCKDSCSIGTGRDMSMNIEMGMNIRNSVRSPVHKLVRNPDQQPMKYKAPKGQVAL
jgi:hypothetical protein